jgi:hypothetical protein
MAILEAADVASITASPDKPKMDRLATVPTGEEVGRFCMTEGGEDHVEHAGARSQLLSELGQELGSHRCAHVVVLQLRPDPGGINAPGDHMVGGEGNHRINLPRRRGQDLDEPIGGREPAGSRVPQHGRQPTLVAAGLPTRTLDQDSRNNAGL